jgi:hypothetical protein
MASRSSRFLVTRTVRLQIENLSKAPKINTAGLIDFYQDYIFLRDYIREEQRKAKLLTIDNTLGGRHI